MKYIFPGITLVSIVFLVVSCGPKNQQPAEQKEAAVVMAKAPDFNADSAYHYVQKQVDFGPRVPNTKAHLACADYLIGSLKKSCDDVIVQEAKVRAFDGTTLNIRNIIGIINPEAAYRIMLCAHWDTRPFADHDPDPANYNKAISGANDGGSGTAVLLEIARQLKLNDPGIGVDIILFDGEDYGQPQDYQPQQEDTWCLGSQYWGKNPHVPNYTAAFGILLDMVGARGATFLKEEYSMYYAPDIVNKIWSTASQLGFSSFFPDMEGGAVTDDHYYVNTLRKFPCVDIIHQDMLGRHSFFEHWHTMNDTMESIDPLTLKACGQTVLQVIFNAAQKPVS